MKGNVWLAGYIVLTLLAIGATGFYTLKQFGNYKDKLNGWNKRSSKIERLTKEVPTPSQASEEQFEKELEAYEAKVAALFESLNQFQQPLNEQLNQTDFPNILKQKVDDFRKLADENRMDITSLDRPLPFFMAMDRYRETLPKQEITPLLGYQLDAIEQILKHLVDAGTGKIDELVREDLPGEVEDSRASAASGPGDVVLKYPVRVQFEGTHSSFRDFLNRLANDKEFFFILRVLSVANSAPDGPDFASDLVVAGYKDENGNDVTTDDIDAVLGGLTGQELQDKLNEVGWVPKRQDALIIFGEETVKIIAVIDLVRFLSPEEAEAAAEAQEEPEDNSRPTRRRRPGNS